MSHRIGVKGRRVPLAGARSSVVPDRAPVHGGVGRYTARLYCERCGQKRTTCLCNPVEDTYTVLCERCGELLTVERCVNGDMWCEACETNDDGKR